MIAYRCRDLRVLKQGERVRNIHDAARIFAHRIARKLFGNGGRCITISQYAQVNETRMYIALIGTAGMSQEVRLPVVPIHIE